MLGSSVTHCLRIAFVALAIIAMPVPGGGANEATPTSDDDAFEIGWAVVVLDEPLSSVVAGEETVVHFKVLHMGRADREVENAIVVFTVSHVDSDDSVTEIAQLLDNPAEYEATFVLDREGAWDWTAFVYNVGSMNPQATRLPSLKAVKRGALVHSPANEVATPIPGGPGYIRLENDRLNPWHLEVPLGLNVFFQNDRMYVIRILHNGSPIDGAGGLFPGSSTMWYSLAPGDYLFITGPAPAFMVGTITVTGEAWTGTMPGLSRTNWMLQQTLELFAIDVAAGEDHYGLAARFGACPAREQTGE